MKSRKIIFSLAGLFVFLFAIGTAFAQATWQEPTQAPPGGNVNPPVWLQSATPGSAQTGHINVSGTIIADTIKANSGITINGSSVCVQGGAGCGGGSLLSTLQAGSDASTFSSTTPVKISQTSILAIGANAGGLVVRSNAADANAQNFAIYINPSTGPEGIYSKGQIQIAVVGDKSGTGNPPLVVQSSKMVDNLNAKYLEGSTKAEIIAAAQTGGGGGTTEYYIYEAKGTGGNATCSSGYHIIAYSCNTGGVSTLTTTSVTCGGGAYAVCESDFPRLISAPSNLTATLVTATQVNLAWTNSTPQGESIKVERKEDAGAYSVIATLVISATAYTDSTVQQGRSYTYRVYIFNSGGANSPYSNEAGVSSDLTAPTGLAVTGGTGTSIILGWTDNNTGEDGYKIERQAEGETVFTEVASVAASSYTNSGLTTGVQYTYQVRAYKGTNNSGYSNQITTRVGLAGPTGFAVSSKGVTSINLSWNDNAVSEDGYKLEYWTWDGSNNVTGQQILILAANTTSRSITGLEEGRYYGFKVYAYTGAYTSNEKPELETPTVLTAPSASGIGIKTYIDNIYNIYAFDNSIGESGFRANIFENGTYIADKIIGAVSGTGGQVTFSDFGWAGLMQVGDYYKVQYAAYRDTGSRPRVWSSWVDSAQRGVLNPPTSLSVNRIGNSATLNWSSGGASEHTVCKKASGINPGSSPCANDGSPVLTSSSSYTYTGLSGGTNYDYQVCATWSSNDIIGACSRVSD